MSGPAGSEPGGRWSMRTTRGRGRDNRIPVQGRCDRRAAVRDRARTERKRLGRSLFGGRPYPFPPGLARAVGVSRVRRRRTPLAVAVAGADGAGRGRGEAGSGVGQATCAKHGVGDVDDRAVGVLAGPVQQLPGLGRG